MNLHHEFEVDSDLKSTWELLCDLQAYIPCLPGAYFIGEEGEELKMGVKVKIGAISSNFRSTVRFVEKNVEKYMAVIHGTGEDVGGKGKASATITIVLQEISPERTRAVVDSDVAITGKIAQFGGPIIEDVGSRIFDQFAVNLNKMLVANKSQASGESSNETPKEASATSASAAQSSSAEPISAANAESQAEALDLGSVVGPVMLKYAVKYLLVPVGFFALGWVVRGFM